MLAENAMNAGCAAGIIHNIQPGNYNGTLGEPTAPDGRVNALRAVQTP